MVGAVTDIVVTWPQTRSLASYVEELAKAERDGLVINYRVSNLPRERPDRCYMVHTGRVRGWTKVVDMMKRDDVTDPVKRTIMPAGLFIVREPVWHLLALVEQREMRGFQGWRYFER